jgi:hypothetical protein
VLQSDIFACPAAPSKISEIKTKRHCAPQAKCQFVKIRSVIEFA